MPKLAGRAPLLMLLIAGACAPVAEPIIAPAPAAPPASGPDTVTRVALQPLTPPEEFRSAVQRGTRTTTGQPGARYWQQRVRYRIQAELDPRTAMLTGRETIVYRNSSPDTLTAVVLNLYQNLFTDRFVAPRSPQNTGGFTLDRVVVQGETMGAVTPQQAEANVREGRAVRGYVVQGTLGRVFLPRPLVPGDSAILEIDWKHKVPPTGAPRTAYEDALGGRVLQVGQWYPQVAVYDDVTGFDVTPYQGEGEFYLEYGDFDVSLTLPAGYLVGATGTLQNPEQVLTPAARQRLSAALRTDSVVSVVTEADLRSRTATQAGVGGRVTWRFTAKDVRDFAFATSDRYVWDATRATIGGAERGTRTVQVHSLYRPGAPGWERAARYGQHSTEYFSRLLIAYLYPQITITEGPIYGMEYPMVVFVGRPTQAEALYEVIAHEIGHEWFPMMIGQDEAAFAWMDEGITTFYESLAVNDFFPGANAFEEPREAYLQAAGRRGEVALSQHIDQVQGPAAAISAYYKPGTLMRSLRAVVGDDVFNRAMRTYAREWLLKHPQPWDFFNTFERVSGRDLDWFFYPWWFGTGTLDQAITGVTPTPGNVAITVRDLGDMPVPTTVVVTTAAGTTARAQIPIERWTTERLRTTTVTVPVTGQVVRVELDPEQLFPDVNRRNNVWLAGDR